MQNSRFLTSLGLIAIGVVLMGAVKSPASPTYETRPRMVQEGVVVVSVDRNSAAVNPLRYLVVDVDGPWIQVQLLRKKKKDKKGQPFWLRMQDIGAFIVE